MRKLSVREGWSICQRISTSTSKRHTLIGLMRCVTHYHCQARCHCAQTNIDCIPTLWQDLPDNPPAAIINKFIKRHVVGECVYLFTTLQITNCNFPGVQKIRCFPRVGTNPTTLQKKNPQVGTQNCGYQVFDNAWKRLQMFWYIVIYFQTFVHTFKPFLTFLFW